MDVQVQVCMILVLAVLSAVTTGEITCDSSGTVQKGKCFDVNCTYPLRANTSALIVEWKKESDNAADTHNGFNHLLKCDYNGKHHCSWEIETMKGVYEVITEENEEKLKLILRFTNDQLTNSGTFKCDVEGNGYNTSSCEVKINETPELIADCRWIETDLKCSILSTNFNLTLKIPSANTLHEKKYTCSLPDDELQTIKRMIIGVLVLIGFVLIIQLFFFIKCIICYHLVRKKSDPSNDFCNCCFNICNIEKPIADTGSRASECFAQKDTGAQQTTSDIDDAKRKGPKEDEPLIKDDSASAPVTSEEKF